MFLVVGSLAVGCWLSLLVVVDDVVDVIFVVVVVVVVGRLFVGC